MLEMRRISTSIIYLKEVLINAENSIILHSCELGAKKPFDIRLSR